ncbi:MAG: ABC transporter permease, partial [Alphaproteobacteria bacterium]|nr:ABC transporter permease [Alphaproteobacteria bacterium]
MTHEPGWIREGTTGGRLVLAAGGGWTVAGAATLEGLVAALEPGAVRDVAFDLTEISALDTAGVWLLR